MATAQKITLQIALFRLSQSRVLHISLNEAQK